SLLAFIGGGTLSIIAQLLLDLYSNYLDKDIAVAAMIMTIIFITALLTGIGIYDKAAQHLGAGLFIPISGFSNALTSAAIESKSEGLIYGIGSNMFKLAGSVITYGIVSAYIVAFINYMVTLL
ncbi:MAG: SpoVA/SpoVAEb family sporulation membrane protein, partial [Erysipelotrichaceae bacterium]